MRVGPSIAPRLHGLARAEPGVRCRRLIWRGREAFGRPWRPPSLCRWPGQNGQGFMCKIGRRESLAVRSPLRCPLDACPALPPGTVISRFASHPGHQRQWNLLCVPKLPRVALRVRPRVAGRHWRWALCSYAPCGATMSARARLIEHGASALVSTVGYAFALFPACCRIKAAVGLQTRPQR